MEVILSTAFATLVGVVLVWVVLSHKDEGFLKSFKPDKSYLPYCLILDEDMTEQFPQVTLAVSDAAAFINESVGHKMFEFLELGGQGEIIPVLLWEPESCAEGECHENAFAFTKISTEGKPEAVFIVGDQINELSYEKLLYGVAHELGHVLGLSHDSFTTSFMYPKIIEEFPEMTSKDISRIKEAYDL